MHRTGIVVEKARDAGRQPEIRPDQWQQRSDRQDLGSHRQRGEEEAGDDPREGRQCRTAWIRASLAVIGGTRAC